jgi:hypothetical protein
VEIVLEEGEEASNEYEFGGSETAAGPKIGNAEATAKPIKPGQVSFNEEERTSKDDLLKDMAQQQREQKAVKSDDAAVPEYLWEEHLMTGSEVNDWNSKSIDNLR